MHDGLSKTMVAVWPLASLNHKTVRCTGSLESVVALHRQHTLSQSTVSFCTERTRVKSIGVTCLFLQGCTAAVPGGGIPPLKCRASLFEKHKGGTLFVLISGISTAHGPLSARLSRQFADLPFIRSYLYKNAYSTAWIDKQTPTQLLQHTTPPPSHKHAQHTPPRSSRRGRISRS